MTKPMRPAYQNRCEGDAMTMRSDARGRGRELLTNSPSTPPSPESRANDATMAMDGPSAAELQERRRQADHASGRWCGECRWNTVETPICCYGPDDDAPVESVTGQAPVGRWVAPRGGYVEDRDDAESDAAFRDGLAAIRERGARTAALPRPVAAVVACPEVLVVACARAEYERFRAVLVSRSPFGRLIPAWDDDLGWARSTFARQARIDAMRERLEVLWPVIVEHFGGAS